MEFNNIIGWKQIGFRKDFTPLDHSQILFHSAKKYTSLLEGVLYVAFMDLKGAFDSISGSELWNKLRKSTIDRQLLRLKDNHIG